MRKRSGYRQHEFFLKAGPIARCANCGVTGNLSVDHIIPLSQGGSDEDSNRQLLCRDCVIRKHGSSPAVQGDNMVAHCRICHHAGFRTSLGEQLQREIYRHWTSLKYRDRHSQNLPEQIPIIPVVVQRLT